MPGNRRIDRISAEQYLDKIASKPMDEVRAMRDECQDEESALSYARRLMQARIDILGAELARRAGNGGSLIDRLPEILADEGGRPSRGTHPSFEPSMPTDNPKRRIEKLVSDDTLTRLGDLDSAEIERIVTALSEAEREVSEQRKIVHDVVDKITAEIVRRYSSGEANPADLLAR